MIAMKKLLSIVAGLMVLAPWSIPVQAAADCTFVESFAARSGEMPYAGSLDGQVAATLENTPEYDELMIQNDRRVGGMKAARVFIREQQSIREFWYVNRNGKSYQLHLISTPATYRQQQRNLRKLMKQPFAEQQHLCA